METEKTGKMGMLKRFLSFVLCCALLLSCVPVTVFAEKSGTCGKNLKWTLSDNGVLTISGSGAMPDYSDASYAPWYYDRNSIRSITVSDGVTHIGSNAFRGSGVQAVSFGNASLSLGNYCFAYCESLTSIDFGSGTIQPGDNVFQDCDALTSVHVPANVVMNGNYSGIGSGLGMFGFCRNLQTATVDCSYVGPFFFECCYAMTQATFTNKDVNFYYLDNNSGQTFRGSSQPMNVTVVGHLCSKANVLAQKKMSECTLTFQQIAGDTTQHTEQIVPGTATCIQDGLSEGKICATCGLVLVEQEITSGTHHFENNVCIDCGTAGGTCGENLTWTLSDNGVLTISGSGQMEDYSSDDKVPWYGSRAEITSVIIREGVTSIGRYAFDSCSNMKSINIPEGVTSIGDVAFYGCSSLSSITIPEGVTSIGKSVFFGCRSLSSINLPEGITSIAWGTFNDCTSLSSITIPEGVTSIGGSAFFGCSSLSSISIPEGVTSIGWYAFQYCGILRSITIPEGVTSIGYSAFSGCCSLSSITIPEGVTCIEHDTFSGCSSLSSITIPAGVTSIESSAFSNCKKLTCVVFTGAAPSIDSYAFSNVTATVLYPGNDASWTTDKRVNYGGKLTWISSSEHVHTYTPAVTAPTCMEQGYTTYTCNCGDSYVADFVDATGHSFENGACTACGVTGGSCGSNLTWTITDDGVLTISGSGSMDSFSTAPWYSHRENVEKVIIQEGVTSICKNAFSDLPTAAKEDVSVPLSVTSIGLAPGFSSAKYAGTMAQWQAINFAFADNYWYAPGAQCTDGTILTLGFCGTRSYGVTDYPRYILTGDGHMRIYGNGAMSFYKYYYYSPHWSSYCSAITSVTIEEGITSVANYAFKNCQNLTSVSLPSTVTSIGADAFLSCSSLKQITLPAGLTSLSSNAFKESGLESIIIPESVTYLARYAFFGCKSLSSITIPTSVTSIYEYAFEYCDALQNVTYGGTAKQWKAVTISSGNDPLLNAQFQFYNPCPNGHTEVVDPAVTPTCTQTGLTEGKHCSVCEEILVVQQTVPTLDHDYAEATCTIPKTCRACSTTEGNPLGHSFTRYASNNDATCTEDGTETAVCDREGCEETDTHPAENSALGHSFTRYASNNDATCTEDGTETAVCDREGCEETDTRTAENSALGHSFTQYASNNDATCTENGTETAVCDREGCEETDTHTAEDSALGHSFTQYASNNDATCTKDGTETAVCDREGCEETDTHTAENSALGHSFTQYASNNDATCTENGTETAVCDREGCEEADTRTAENSALGHTEETIPGTAATCTETGLTDGKKCSVCGEILVDQTVIDALGHTEETIPGRAATCTRTGLTDGKKCSVCGEILEEREIIPLAAHTEEPIPGRAATCTRTGLTDGKECIVCGKILVSQTVIDALGHTEETIPGRAATCTRTGLTEGKKCSVCGEILEERELIPLAAHTEETIPGRAATCTRTGLTEGKKCSVCGEILEEREIIPLAAHTEETIPGRAATCTRTGLTDGKKCSVCGEILEERELIPLAAHTEETIPGRAATCTRTGLTSGKECSVCGKILVGQTVIDALGHDEETIPGRAATCTRTGLTDGKKCSVCGEILEEQEIIPVTAHTEETIPGRAATCTRTGLTDGKKCSVCGAILEEQKTIPVGGHTEEIIPGKAAGCTETGLTDGKKCSVCGEVLAIQEIIDATGHSCSKVDLKKATLDEDGYRTHYECGGCEKWFEDSSGKIEVNQSHYRIPAVKTVKLSSTRYSYNGKTKTPKVGVYDSDGNKLVKDVDYTVTYAKGRKSVGKYNVTMKGTGDYDFRTTLTFQIVPAKSKITKLTGKTKAFTASWSKKTSQVTGYQLQYSLDKNFETGVKTVTIKDNAVTSKTIKSLKSKKYYYVRIRTYKTVSGKNFYSSWSDALRVKTK